MPIEASSPPPMPRWFVHACGHLGERELSDGKLSSFVRDCFRHTRFALSRVTNSTPWCAAYVCRVLEAVGIVSPRSAAARDFLRWGVALDAPAPGAILVFARGPLQGHVGFAVGYARGGLVDVLGGNQRNSVCIVRRKVADVIGVRWPPGEPLPAGARRG